MFFGIDECGVVFDGFPIYNISMIRQGQRSFRSEVTDIPNKDVLIFDLMTL